MSFTGSPTGFNRSPSVQAKLKSLFEDAEDGSMQVSQLKNAVTGEKNALKYDWGGAGLLRNKVVDALDSLAEGGDRSVTFVEFWDTITGNAAKPRIDPLVEVEQYLSKNKLVPLVENMAAALLYEKPDNPRAFLIQKLARISQSRRTAPPDPLLTIALPPAVPPPGGRRSGIASARETALRATGEEPHHFTDDDLAAMFGTFDVSGRGVVTASQTNEAVRVLTGMDGDEALSVDPGRKLERKEFTEHARVALTNQLGAVAVAPSR